MKLKKGYKHTEIVVIPIDWDISSLGTLGHFSKGKGIKKDEVLNEGLPCVRYGELYTQYDNVITKFNSFISAETAKLSRKVRNGDILFAGSGETKEEIGKCATINSNTDAYAGGDIIIFTPKNCNSILLGYLLNSYSIQRQKAKKGQGDAVVHIYSSGLAKIQIPIPPTLQEQKAITNVLSDTDELINTLKTFITKKKAIKQGTMQELLTGKKRLQGFIGEWHEKPLEDIANIKTGSKNNQDKKEDGIYPFFVRSQTVERINSYSYDCEAILVPGEGGIGSIFHYINGKFDVHQRVYVINKFSHYVNGKFIYLYMKQFFGKHAIQNSVKATVDSLRLPTFQEFQIKLPPNIEEQKAIAQILSDMDIEIKALETQLQKNQYLKQGMMQQLLTGKTRLLTSANTTKAKTESKKHNKHFNDAVIISVLAKQYSSESIPLSRFKYTKVSYLLKRYKEEQTQDYLKKAAGPYNPQTRYGGAEKIALTNKYIKKHTSTYKNTEYTGFLPDDNIEEALNYFLEWYGKESLHWIDQFKKARRNDLELWATVDMATEDLKKAEKPINFKTIKQLINDHKEWRPKLKRPIFSDANIKEAIPKVNQLFKHQ